MLCLQCRNPRSSLDRILRVPSSLPRKIQTAARTRQRNYEYALSSDYAQQGTRLTERDGSVLSCQVSGRLCAGLHHWDWRCMGNHATSCSLHTCLYFAGCAFNNREFAALLLLWKQRLMSSSLWGYDQSDSLLLQSSSLRKCPPPFIAIRQLTYRAEIGCF